MIRENKIEEKENKDTFSYKGWLTSDYFIKRAFAVLGHYIIAILLIYLPLIVLALAIGE